MPGTFRGYRILSFDCAYRTLGWCVLEYDPAGALAALADGRLGDVHKVIRMTHGGIIDTLGGRTVRSTGDVDRARALRAALGTLPPGPFAAVIIEKQPGRIRGKRGCSQAVEAQLVYHYAAATADSAAQIVLVHPREKNALATRIVGPIAVNSYAERKRQTVAALRRLSELFDFRAGRADLADAVLQALARIFPGGQHIRKGK